MSSAILTTIQNQLNLYGYPISMILGTIGNIFIVIIFNRQNQSSCSIYLTSSAIINILCLMVFGFYRIFPYDYSDATISGIIVCKIVGYTSDVLGLSARTMFMLACIDRFLITNHRVSFRSFSTPKRAKWFTFFSIMFSALIYIHVPIMHTVVYGQCTSVGIYAIFYSVYSIIIVGLFPAIISGVFGYLAYRNMRHIHTRVQPIGENLNNANISIRRRDRDLLIIVIAEVFAHIITTALFPSILLEMVISQYTIPNKSFQYFQNESFTLQVALLLLFMGSAVPFYTYLIASKSFRQDFKQLIINIYWKLRGKTPVRIVPKANKTLTYRDTHI